MRERVVDFLLNTPQGKLWREDALHDFHEKSEAQILQLLPGRSTARLRGEYLQRDIQAWATADVIAIVSMLYEIQIECIVLTKSKTPGIVSPSLKDFYLLYVMQQRP